MMMMSPTKKTEPKTGSIGVDRFSVGHDVIHMSLNPPQPVATGSEAMTMTDDEKDDETTTGPCGPGGPAGTGPRLATVKEACRYGKFSHTKLYSLINAGRIKAKKFDTRTLVDLDSIDAMFATLPDLPPNPGAKS